MENWTIENFTIMGLAILKMLYFFWPLVFIVIAFILSERKSERKDIC
tara:strand:+ start:719 stop:859 length:141 start_codon:yes stop_codon:yes gene_type:complete